MVTLFHDMMHKEIEVYIDDMIANLAKEENHMENLLKLFERLRRYKLRLNPGKCTFGVKSRKVLGFAVSERGIEGHMDEDAYMEQPAIFEHTFLSTRACKLNKAIYGVK
ncbi:Retrovirus-related Pol polyprotein from transposon 17.6 [Gossypium australe]|uniref:Retrovirus-related Pol polyprotein from transposon 17.6 n=1 Tax=Gossypium australe TaxID=47621 RepID=A0A5B6VDI0_9ROSI|nr:Retrovirus-related Pol polyprotein from transposon 17.6 [Gossypium australe]